MLTQFGRELRKLQIEKDISNTKLSALMGVPQSRASARVHGRTVVKAAFLDAVCAAMGLDAVAQSRLRTMAQEDNRRRHSDRVLARLFLREVILRPGAEADKARAALRTFLRRPA